MDNIIIDDKLVEAFHLMYDSFPGVAQLNHKSKLIAATNPAAQAFGRLEGMICSRHGSPRSAPGLPGGKSLKRTKRAVHLHAGDD